MNEYLFSTNYLNYLINEAKNPTGQNYNRGKGKVKEIIEYFMLSTFKLGMALSKEELQNIEDYFMKHYADIEASPDEEVVPEEALAWYENYAIYLTMVFEQDMLNEVQTIVDELIEKGINVRDMPDILAQSERLQGWARNRLNTIARTESTKAYNSGRITQYRNSSIVEAVQYSAILDKRTTTLCRGLNGMIIEVNSHNVNLYMPPNHFNCRSVILPVTRYEDWTESDLSGIDRPDDGFDNPLWKPMNLN